MKKNVKAPMFIVNLQEHEPEVNAVLNLAKLRPALRRRLYHATTITEIETRLQLAAIVDSSDDAIVSKTLDGIVISWNESACHLFGYTASEMIGKSILSIIPSEKRSEEDKILEQIRHGERIKHFETVRIAKDGTHVDVSLTISPLRDFKGTIVGASKIMREIGQQRRAEIAIKQSEENFRLLADAIPQLIWTATRDGLVNYFNAGWYRYTGQTAKQPMDDAWRMSIHSDDLDLMLKEWNRSLLSGTPFELEIRIRNSMDNAFRWFLARAVPVLDVAGDVTQWVGTSTDINDHEHSKQIAHKAAIAEIATRAKSEFLANMSHEIRTPLSAIIGYADLLLDNHLAVSKRINGIDVIRRNARHLLTIINDILDLSKIESGGMSVESIPCDICRIVNDVISTMRAPAKEHRLSLDLVIDSFIPETIRSDPTRLRQILINLIGNAIKFTESGSVRLVVALLGSPHASAPRLRFDVIDSGIGISPDQISSLFQPFVQGDSSTTRKFGGTGLGLTISRSLARTLGGDITVQSVLGVGSTFALSVTTGPLDNVRLLSECQEAIVDISAHDATSAPSLMGHILLADDGPDNQSLLSLYLIEAGLTVTLADNGRIAYEKIKNSFRETSVAPFNLILMDMQMPEMDGYIATAKIRAEGYDIPIIALTANAMATDREKCIRAGCTDYLSKPIRREDLLNAISRNLKLLEVLNDNKADGWLERAQSGIHGNTISNHIYSSTAETNIQPLVVAYVTSLPETILDLKACLNDRDLSRLACKIHNLKGTGGMFGLPCISLAAEDVDRALHNEETFDLIAAKTDMLIATLHRIKNK